jgi:hypothetical protein
MIELGHIRARWDYAGRRREQCGTAAAPVTGIDPSEEPRQAHLDNLELGTLEGRSRRVVIASNRLVRRDGMAGADDDTRATSAVYVANASH